MKATDARTARNRRPLPAAMLAALLVMVAPPAVTLTQEALTDICGCADAPDSLGAFDTRNSATWPPGSQLSGSAIVIPLPPDGVMVFDSFWVQDGGSGFSCFGEVVFARNAANTPVTLLIKGDFRTVDGCGTGFPRVRVSGGAGTSGSVGAAGTGGGPGPGGFRGGDGAYRDSNLASDGGAGFGPGGGAPGTGSPLSHGTGGTFLGLPELVPLAGGSGGGGGASSAGGNCSAGGGGGGGGALLIAANGTIRFDGEIIADGGAGGSRSNSACSSSGAGGSGGAIRLVARSIVGTAAGNLLARGGGGGSGAAAGGRGSVRLEAPSISVPDHMTDEPVAMRVPAPGPLVSPLTPTVTITHVAGALVTQPPTGGVGGIDIVVSAPGVVGIDLATSGVPSGTTVDVTVKPRVGGLPLVANTTLVNCDTAGNCLASVPIDLASGSYVIEARATFATPVP